jgi:hypothetical protein
MIDEIRLLQRLHDVRGSLFGDYQQKIDQARILWLRCIEQAPTYEQLSSCTQEPLARWQKTLGYKKCVQAAANYRVMAIDGSQVYPSRHEGLRVALINIGGLTINYDHCSQIDFFCEPFVYGGSVDENVPAIIDCERQARELATSVDLLASNPLVDDKRVSVLFDGSLIFWHLQEHASLRERYCDRYCGYLEQLRRMAVPCAWYTSLPQSRDIIRIVRAYAHINGEVPVLDDCTDDDIMSHWLQPYERTTLFESTVGLVYNYPELLRPYFFYIHTGAEIARVEVPAWLIACNAENQQLFVQESLGDELASLIVDQCVKGDGYPVSLALAHEQAVVTHRDREFFVRLVADMAAQHAVPMRISRKLLKKRSLAI